MIEFVSLIVCGPLRVLLTLVVIGLWHKLSTSDVQDDHTWFCGQLEIKAK